ncbi:Neuropeptide FF receptor 2 [Trichoplax sp. H2]|nr:Neuropeptide FF receptor 2 [Trichoplax sp. H2]|eukprot:RDD43212.1 Neuropeptide FF receptor 2 [Trichoplax sp. H2]
MDNNSSTTLIDLGPSHTVRIILITIAAIIFMVSLVGNIMVCLAVLYNKSSTKCTNIFLLNLAISDLLITISIPFAVTTDVLGIFIFGDVMCKLVFSVRNCGIAISSLTLVIVAFDRYYAVYYAANQLQRKVAVILLLVLWFISCVAVIPQVIGLRVEFYENIGYICREYYLPEFRINELAYTVSLIGLFFLSPFLVIVILHSLIVQKLWRTRRRLSSNTPPSKSPPRSYQQVYIMLFTVTMAFFWTLLPTYTLQLLLSLNVIDGPTITVYTAYYITTWLGYSHVMWNPIIYGLLNKKMRKDMASIFRHSTTMSVLGKS